MNKDPRHMTILLAEDDPDDRLLAQEALMEGNGPHKLFCVVDGEELMDYLHHRGRFSDPRRAPRPGLILMDLNMPRKDGREALKEIKSDPALRRIPVVVLTTSQNAEDVFDSYDLGGNSYIHKPVSFAGLVKVIKLVSQYWCETVEVAPGERQV